MAVCACFNMVHKVFPDYLKCMMSRLATRDPEKDKWNQMDCWMDVSGASHTVNILKVEMLLPASATDSSSVSQGQ